MGRYHGVTTCWKRLALLWLVGLPLSAALRPSTVCPVQSTLSACSSYTTCTNNDQCSSSEDVQNWCCPTSCGHNACVRVNSPCIGPNGAQYIHHQHMESVTDWETDECRLCYCQNGQKKCREWNCTYDPWP